MKFATRCPLEPGHGQHSRSIPKGKSVRRNHNKLLIVNYCIVTAERVELAAHPTLAVLAIRPNELPCPTSLASEPSLAWR